MAVHSSCRARPVFAAYIYIYRCISHATRRMPLYCGAEPAKTREDGVPSKAETRDYDSHEEDIFEDLYRSVGRYQVRPHNGRWQPQFNWEDEIETAAMEDPDKAPELFPACNCRRMHLCGCERPGGRATLSKAQPWHFTQKGSRCMRYVMVAPSLQYVYVFTRLDNAMSKGRTRHRIKAQGCLYPGPAPSYPMDSARVVPGLRRVSIMRIITWQRVMGAPTVPRTKNLACRLCVSNATGNCRGH